jgi:cholesterol oxidase
LAHNVGRRFSAKVNSDTHGLIIDVLNIPATAHYIGGCVIGEDPESGVVDPYQRVYRHPGLHVADGSAVTANLGVNPSLTITAQAERAMAFWPNKNEADQRPELGSPYQRVNPVAPKHPTVPAAAPGALRLPITQVVPTATVHLGPNTPRLAADAANRAGFLVSFPPIECRREGRS